jgi:hypothetical protein
MPLRAIVRLPPNLPIQQIEVEVIAGLLDDWESLIPAEDGTQKP